MVQSSTIAPAASSLPLVPPPRPRTRLFGRDREHALAEEFLRRADVGLLSLTGAGGSGKTRLALAVAARQATYFADGIAWVPLAAVATDDQVMPAIARAVGVLFRRLAISRAAARVAKCRGALGGSRQPWFGEVM
jgi:hypothetical protein